MIGRTYDRLAFSERESSGSKRSKTAVPVYTHQPYRRRRHRCASVPRGRQDQMRNAVGVSEYAMLMLPSANRVYGQAAVELTQAELELFSAAALGGRLRDIAPATIAGVPYLTFRSDDLRDRDVAFLSNVSAIYALFERRDGLLRPVPLTPLDRYDDDLITIQKYAGKTNEQFTKLLLNVTLLSSASAGDMLSRRLRVLDPLCGRGTTLNQALMYGYDAAGLDLDTKDFEAYTGFLSTYLKRKRIKHHLTVTPVRRERRVVARRLSATLSPTKESLRRGEVQSVDVVNADAVAATEFFRPASFDVLVADAPYGVQHGSRTAGKGLRRAPLDLLAEAVPGWGQLLRRGGAMGISWNTYVARREDLAAILTDAGLRVCEGGPYERFRHRVDQAIIRDIVVATKPA